MSGWRCTACNAPTRDYPVCRPCFPVYLRADAARWLAARERRRQRWGWLPGTCVSCALARGACRCVGGPDSELPKADPAPVLPAFSTGAWLLAFAAERLGVLEGGRL